MLRLLVASRGAGAPSTWAIASRHLSTKPLDVLPRRCHKAFYPRFWTSGGNGHPAHPDGRPWTEYSGTYSWTTSGRWKVVWMPFICSRMRSVGTSLPDDYRRLFLPPCPVGIRDCLRHDPSALQLSAFCLSSWYSKAEKRSTPRIFLANLYAPAALGRTPARDVQRRRRKGCGQAAPHRAPHGYRASKRRDAPRLLVAHISGGASGLTQHGRAFTEACRRLRFVSAPIAGVHMRQRVTRPRFRVHLLADTLCDNCGTLRGRRLCSHGTHPVRAAPTVLIDPSRVWAAPGPATETLPA